MKALRRGDVVFVNGKAVSVLDVQNSKTGYGVFVKGDGKAFWVRKSDCKRKPVSPGG